MNLRMLYGSGCDFAVLDPLPARAAVELLRRLVLDPEGCGSKELEAPSGHQRFPGGCSLVGWRSVKVPNLSYETTLVIVYKEGNDGVLEILAVAPRMGSECYKLAMSRLVEHQEQRDVERRWERMARLRIAEQRRARSRH